MRSRFAATLAKQVEDSEPTFYETVGLNFDRAVSLLIHNVKGHHYKSYERAAEGIWYGILNLVKPCNHTLAVDIPINRDNGDIETIGAYLA